MSFPVPTLYLSKSNAKGPPGVESTTFWGDIDANRVSGALVTVFGDLNLVSGSVYGVPQHAALSYSAGALATVRKWEDAGETVPFQQVDLSYSAGLLASVVVREYTTGSLRRTITKTLSYSGGALVSVSATIV